MLLPTSKRDTRPALAQSVLDQGRSRLAAGDAEHLMRELKTRRVHRAFDSIDERVCGDRSVDRWASCVAPATRGQQARVID
jgi:hypothetical protein